VIWIVLWFATIPGALVRGAAESSPAAEGSRFRDVLRDRRLWLLLVTVIAINITWHGYRAWLPLYLQEQRGFNEAQMSRFTTYYYLVADVGSWTVGGMTLVLCRRGMSLHLSRLIGYGGCAVLTMTTLLVPFLPDGWPLKLALLLVAFGALGLFPCYFALSQEVSAKHQGKITGTLGFAAHFSLAMIYPLEGIISDVTRSYDLVLCIVGVPPLFAFAAVLWKWPRQGAPM
jgi:ACS family hexuronate transporter-like MFS transporter